MIVAHIGTRIYYQISLSTWCRCSTEGLIARPLACKNPRSCRGTYMAHASGSILMRFSVSSTVFLMILKRSSLEMALLHQSVATLVTDSMKKFLFSSLMMPASPPVGIFRLKSQSCSLLSSLRKPLVGWIYIFSDIIQSESA